MAEEKKKKAGAPLGNTNGVKNRPLTEMLTEMLLANKAAKAKSILSVVMQKAEEGDMDAIKFIAERVEGKALQPVAGEFKQSITVKLVQF